MAVEFAVTVYLMRLLGPEPFGLMAMAMAVLALAVVLQDGGAAASLISDPEFSDRRTGAALAVGLGLGLVLYLLCLAITPVVTLWYGDSRVGQLWSVVSLMVLMSGIGAVPNAIAQRQQRFDAITWLPLASTLITSLAVILVVQSHPVVWVLVLNVLGSAAINNLLFWLIIRPKLSMPSRSDIGHVLNFSKGVIISSFFAAVQRNGDDMIVGRVLGAGAAGLYNFSYRMLQLPLRELGGVIDKLAYARLASFGQDAGRIAGGVGQIVFEATLLVTPAAIGICLLAPDLIVTVFGERWLPALLPFQIFSLLTIYQVPSARLGLVFLLTRRTGRMAKWAFVSTPVILLGFALGATWGIAGVASGYALASLLLGYWRVRWVADLLDGRSSFFWYNWLRALLSGAFIAVIPFLLNLGLESLQADERLRLAVVVAAYALSTLAAYAYLIARRRRVRPSW